MNDFGQRLKQHYQEHIGKMKATNDGTFMSLHYKIAYHGNFGGMSDAEIDQVRVAQTVDHLPQIYVDFLRVMGHQAGGIFAGCSVSLGELLILKKALLNMMAQNRGINLTIPHLPEGAFVFLCIQGVDFFFFDTASGEDDPPVLYYMDSLSRFYPVAETLSSWLWEQAFNPTKLTEELVKDEMNAMKRGKSS